MHKTLGIQFAHPMTKLSPLLHTLITPLGAMHCLLHIRSGKLESSQSICLGFGFFLPLCFRFFFVVAGYMHIFILSSPGKHGGCKLLHYSVARVYIGNGKVRPI